MEKSSTFLGWMSVGLAQDGFVAWAVKNIDTLIVCLLFGLSSSVFSAYKENADMRRLLLGLLSTFVLIAAVIWVADDYGVRKIWWPIISIAIGLSSLLIVGAYMRFAKTTTDNLPDKVSDAITERVTHMINPEDKK